MDCIPVLSCENVPSVSVFKSSQIRIHTFPGQFHFQKIAFRHCSQSAKCVQLFVMSPNRIFIMSSWQRTNIPSFFSPSAHLPNFPSQIRTQFVVFWRVFLQVFWEGNFGSEYLVTGNSSWDEIWRDARMQKKESVCQFSALDQVIWSVFKASQ